MKQLPKVELNGKEYFFDEKLEQLRNVKNPHEIIDLTNDEVKKYKNEFDGFLEFDEYREAAGKIIDHISDTIESEYDLVPKERFDDGGEKVECPALIYGGKYYELEDYIYDKVKELVMKRGIRLLHKEM